MKKFMSSHSKNVVLQWIVTSTVLLTFLCKSDHFCENNYQNDITQQDLLNNSYQKTLYWIVVQASTIEDRTKLAESGMSLDIIEEDEVCGIIPVDLIDSIEHAGFIIKSKRPLDEISEQDALKKLPPPSFLHYQQVQQTLQQLASMHKDIASLFSIGKSVQGRELWTLRLNTTEQGTTPSSKPGSVFIGTIHAREHLATTVALELAIWLCENKKNLHDLLAHSDVYITPLTNPDGSDYDLSGNPYRYYRKNMRINYDKKIGVDLNRNFGYGWGGRGSSTITSSETYRGPYAFSEPEACAIKYFLESKRNIKTFISYHSYGELILYPWGNISNPIENQHDRHLHETIAKELAKITGYKPLQASSLYIASGDTCDWTYAACNLISFTIELFPNQFGRHNGSGFYPTETVNIQKTVDNNIKAALYMIDTSQHLDKAT